MVEAGIVAQLDRHRNPGQDMLLIKATGPLRQHRPAGELGQSAMLLEVFVHHVVEDVVVVIFAHSWVPVLRPNVIAVGIVEDKAQQMFMIVEHEQGAVVGVDLRHGENASQVVKHVRLVDAAERRVGTGWLLGIVDNGKVDQIQIVLLAQHQGGGLDQQDVPDAEWLRGQIVNGQQAALAGPAGPDPAKRQKFGRPVC